MTSFTFSKQMIDQHLVKYGIDVQPRIIVRDDRQIAQDFFNAVSDKYADCFESLVQGPDEFQFKKQRVIGEKSIDVPTFVLTVRGPVFTFPLALAGISDEIRWPSNLDEIVLDSLQILMRSHKAKQIVRLGKINEVIFNTDQRSSIEIMQSHFTPFIEDAHEIRVRWNEGDADFNRIFQIDALRQQTIQIREVSGYKVQEAGPPGGYGVAVKVDVNNADMSGPLDDDRLRQVIEHANEVYKNRLMQVLNGE